MDRARRRLERNRALARALGEFAPRGAAQLFFAAGAQPRRPMTVRAFGRAWRRQADEIRAGRLPELLSLYVHVPFCAHKCRYCIYHSQGDFAPEALAAYLERLRAEIEYLAPAFEGLGFVTRYLGGGTPTVLSEEQLEGLLEWLARAFAIRPGGERAFETNPLSLTRAKARLFAAHGFNRVSFGVQTLDPRALAAANRGYQTAELVARAFELLHAERFLINVDLIHGLAGAPPGRLEEDLGRLLAFRPGQVTVYALSPFTPGLAASPPAAAVELVARVLPLAAAAGYEIEVHPTCLGLFRRAGVGSEDRLSQEAREVGRHEVYNDLTTRPFSLLALGPTAFGNLWGRLGYRHAAYPSTSPFDPGAPVVGAFRYGLELERRRFVATELASQEGLRSAAYREVFGEPPEASLGQELEDLVELGLLRRTRAGYAHAGPDPVERFAAELFFVPPGLRRRVLARRPGGAGAKARGADGDPPGQGDSGSDPVLGLVQPDGQVLRLALRVHRPGQGCLHHHGGLAVYIPSSLPAGQCRHPPLEEALLRAFCALFERVIEAERPDSPTALAGALLRRGSRLELRLGPAGVRQRVQLRREPDV
jgi:coproporphyrinogen III oxidase-like Fe-S oxidoreductase